MKKLLMTILITPVIAGMALTALAAGRDVPQGRYVASSICANQSIDNVTINPENVWAPTGKKVPIEVSGDVSVDPPCSITYMSFTLTSDTGIVPGTITIDNGHFSGTVMVNLSKDGQIKEGKSYSGTIFATGSGPAGSGYLQFNIIRPFSVTVMHDRGEK